jgi:hypothetical protein
MNAQGTLRSELRTTTRACHGCFGLSLRHADLMKTIRLSLEDIEAKTETLKDEDA